VWILEHRINDEFRGPPKRQVITVLWWAFKLSSYFGCWSIKIFDIIYVKENKGITSLGFFGCLVA
jgi:hypothetical protein